MPPPEIKTRMLDPFQRLKSRDSRSSVEYCSWSSYDQLMDKLGVAPPHRHSFY
jgi:hypothetical protein